MSETAIQFTTAGCKTMADDTLRLMIDISPADAHAAFQMFGQRGIPGAVARLKMPHEQAPAEATERGPYGEHARALVAAGFFRSPAVWRLAGTDEQFRRWVQEQPSCISKTYSETLENGEGRCIAAHVRRAGESGTGYKAEYACVPLTHDEHEHQHNHGELSCLRCYGPLESGSTDQDSKEWFDRKRIHYVQTWAKEQITRQFMVDSLTKVCPPVMLAWAEDNGVDNLLPSIYRVAA